MQYSFKAQRYSAVIDNLAARGVAGLPDDIGGWGTDMLAFEQVVSKYVKGYVDVYWPTDDAVFADEALLEFWEVCVCVFV